MFLDMEEYSDDELFASVRKGEEVKKFLSSEVGKRIVEHAKNSHRMAVMALTAFSTGHYDLNKEADRESLARMLKDLSEPTTVLNIFSKFLIESDRSEEQLIQRDMEET